MFSIPAIVGPMRFLPSGNKLNSISMYLGYNWFLCLNHGKAITKINEIQKKAISNEAQKLFKESHIWKKSYHFTMILLEALPIIGHIVAAVEAIFHRIKIKSEYSFEAYSDTDRKALAGLKREDIEQMILKIQIGSRKLDDVEKKYKDSPLLAFRCLEENICTDLKGFSEKIQKDHNIWYTAVSLRPKLIHLLPANLRREESLLLNLIETHGSFFFENAPKDLRSDYSFCLLAVRKHSSIYEHISREFKAERQMVLSAFASKSISENSTDCKHRAQNYNLVPRALRDDPSLIRDIIKINGYVLEHLTEEQRDDESLVLSAIRSNYEAYSYASDRLRKSKDFFMKALKCNASVFRYAPKEIKQDKAIVLQVLDKDGAMIEFLFDSLRLDREVAIRALRGAGEVGAAFNKMSSSFYSDKEIVGIALDFHGEFYAYQILAKAGSHLKDDKEIVLKSVTFQGESLKDASDRLKDDSDVVLKATLKRGSAFRYASDRLKKDREFISKALALTEEPRNFWEEVDSKLQSDASLKDLYDKMLAKKQ